ncbi:hypothetical protein ACWEV4_35405 [Streptomyces sp. NPDC003860]
MLESVDFLVLLSTGGAGSDLATELAPHRASRPVRAVLEQLDPA